MNEWVILNSLGLPAVTFSTMLDIDIKNAGKVPQYPLEEGSLAAYNKVTSPLDIYVTLGIMGEVSELSSAIDTLNLLKDSVELVSLVTPEREYESLTLESYNYARKREDGLGVIYFELHLVEIKQVTPKYTNTITPKNAKNKESATTQDKGKVGASMLSDLHKGIGGSGRII